MNSNFMKPEQAYLTDLEKIMFIYDRARAFMAENGNSTQWGDGYPFRTDIEADIRSKNCYVFRKQEHICGVFALIPGVEPTYRIIEGGDWMNEKPYATIHRLASDGTCSGIAYRCFEWCAAWCQKHGMELRIDTHADNKVMRHVIEAAGFQRCGIIHVRDGSPRIAWQKRIF